MIPAGRQLTGGDIKPGTLQKLDLRCPPLPATMLRMMELLDDPLEPCPAALVEIARRDPSVAAHLLHVVNGAFYGMRQTIGDVDRAVAILGPHTVAGIIMGMNILQMRSSVDSKRSNHFDDVVRHSVAVAWLSQYMLQISTEDTEENIFASISERDAYSSGLLHDFGKLVLLYSAPEPADQYLSFCTSGHLSSEENPRELERLFFGYDHVEAGEFAVRKLGLPEAIAAVIRFHHAPGEYRGPAETGAVVRLVAAADAAATAFGFGTRGNSTRRGLSRDLERSLIIESGPAQTLANQLQSTRDRLARYVNRLTATE